MAGSRFGGRFRRRVLVVVVMGIGGRVLARRLRLHSVTANERLLWVTVLIVVHMDFGRDRVRGQRIERLLI